MQDLLDLIERNYRKNRTIVSRDVLGILEDVAKACELPLQLNRFPSRTEVATWVIPDRWDVREAWVKAPDGSTIASYDDHPLFVAPYSLPFDGELSLAELKAPVCMSSEELVAYQTTLSLATVGAILERCKASFSDRLDPKQIKAVENANAQVLQQPGSVMRGINARAREPFKRAYPGREASKFADVLQADLQRIMDDARPETIESKAIGYGRNAMVLLSNASGHHIRRRRDPGGNRGESPQGL